MRHEEYDPAIETIRAEREKVRLEKDLADKRSKVDALEEQFRRNVGAGLGSIETVIRFKKQFVEGGTEYTYAAINVNDRWYTTGATLPQGFGQEDFILWLASGIPVTWVDFL